LHKRAGRTGHSAVLRLYLIDLFLKKPDNIYLLNGIKQPVHGRMSDYVFFLSSIANVFCRIEDSVQSRPVGTRNARALAFNNILQINCCALI
jgi:hypothetical protein